MGFVGGCDYLDQPTCKLRCSHQPHDQPSPIDTLPVEILSYIFQQLVIRDPHWRCDFRQLYHKCLRRALVLSSISSHFRHVAFGTPDLWQNVPLVFTSRGSAKAIEKALSLLRFCLTLAPSINISVAGALRKEDAASAVDILLAPDITPKVKSFALCELGNTSNIWIAKFKGSAFPILTTLSMSCYHTISAGFDLRTLTTLARLRIHGWLMDPKSSVAVPPSVRYLDICDVPQHAFLSLLYQSPNLVECVLGTDTRHHDYLGAEVKFTKPLTLMYLNRLSSTIITAISASPSVVNLQLPSLEFLECDVSRRNPLVGILPFCRNVSTTLPTLVMKAKSKELQLPDLLLLCKISFPQLTNLEFHSAYWEPLWNVMYALEQLEGECDNSEFFYFPALLSMTLRYEYARIASDPYRLLDFVKAWKIKRAFYLRIQLTCFEDSHRLRLSHLRAAAKSVVGSRRIELTWGDHKIHEPSDQNENIA